MPISCKFMGLYVSAFIAIAGALKAEAIPPMEINAMIQSVTVDTELLEFMALGLNADPVTFSYSSVTTDHGFAGTLVGVVNGTALSVNYSGVLGGTDSNRTFTTTSTGTFGADPWTSSSSGTIDVFGDPTFIWVSNGVLQVGLSTPPGIVGITIDGTKDFKDEVLRIDASGGVVHVLGRSLLGVNANFVLDQRTGNFKSNGRGEYLFFFHGKWYEVNSGHIDLHPQDPTTTNFEESITISGVPEPSSFALAGLGGLGLTLSAYRRRRAMVV